MNSNKKFYIIFGISYGLMAVAFIAVSAYLGVQVTNFGKDAIEIANLNKQLTELSNRPISVNNTDILQLKTQISDLNRQLNTQTSDLNNQLNTQISDLNKQLNTQTSDLKTQISSRLSAGISSVTTSLPTSTALTTFGIAIGTIMSFCGDATSPSLRPSGFLLCDGMAYLKSQYPDLAKVIGTKFNKSDLKDPAMYFNVPDLRNMFVRGATDDTARGTVQPWKTALPITSKIVTRSAGDHIHKTDAQGKHTHKFTLNSLTLAGSGTRVWGEPNYDGITTITTAEAGEHTHTCDQGGAHTHELTGGDDETCPANVQIHFIIKAENL